MKNKIFICKLGGIVEESDGFRLRVRMMEDHLEALAYNGDYVTTSAVKMIDFERGFAVTRNNIYKWK